jgi:hypothetical protein
MADLTSLPSKVCRAFRWFLVSSGAVDPAHCYHKYDRRARKFKNSDGAPLPIVTVTLLPLRPEEQYSGNEQFIVVVQTAFQATEQPDDLAEAPRVAFDAQVGQVRMQLLQTDDGQELNATRKLINQAAYTMSTPPGDNGVGDRFAVANKDMDDFTLISLYQDVYGNAVDRSDAAIWIIEQRFKVSACESKVDGYA